MATLPTNNHHAPTTVIHNLNTLPRANPHLPRHHIAPMECDTSPTTPSLLVLPPSLPAWPFPLPPCSSFPPFLPVHLSPPSSLVILSPFLHGHPSPFLPAHLSSLPLCLFTPLPTCSSPLPLCLFFLPPSLLIPPLPLCSLFLPLLQLPTTLLFTIVCSKIELFTYIKCTSIFSVRKSRCCKQFWGLSWYDPILMVWYNFPSGMLPLVWYGFIYDIIPFLWYDSIGMVWSPWYGMVSSMISYHWYGMIPLVWYDFIGMVWFHL